MPRSTVWLAVVALFVVVFCACGRAPSQPEAPGAAPLLIEGALSQTVVKSDASQSLFARVVVSTQKRNVGRRPPVNVALCVDTSGSMEGRAIDDARAASLALLDALAPEDRLSVVAFHSKAELLLPSTRIADADPRELRAKINAMRARGTTAMAEGLKMALDEVEHSLVRDGVNRVVLVGDGVPNNDAALEQLTAYASSKGVSITTLGLGNDYDETLMGRIAQVSGGKFSYVDDSKRVASFFKEEVVRLHRVIARSATVDITPGPGVVVKSVIGRPSTPLDRGQRVLLGDITLGEEHEILVELAVDPTKDGRNIEALDAVVAYQEFVGGESREERVFLGAKSTTDEAKIAASKDKAVNDAMLRAQDAAETLRSIEQQRNLQRNNANGFRTNPGNEKSRSPGGGAAAPAAAIPESPEEVRRRHHDAMQNFQAR